MVCSRKGGIADVLYPVSHQYDAEGVAGDARFTLSLSLIHIYPDAFAGHDVEDAIQNDMMLFYFPMALADLRMMASFPGKGLSKETLVYYEVLDWAYPRANYLDVRLMGILEPWDFAKMGPFDPAMQEGDFRVVSVDASTKDQVVIEMCIRDSARPAAPTKARRGFLIPRGRKDYGSFCGCWVNEAIRMGSFVQNYAGLLR